MKVEKATGSNNSVDTSPGSSVDENIDCRNRSKHLCNRPTRVGDSCDELLLTDASVSNMNYENSPQLHDLGGWCGVDPIFAAKWILSGPPARTKAEAGSNNVTSVPSSSVTAVRLTVDGMDCSKRRHDGPATENIEGKYCTGDGSDHALRDPDIEVQLALLVTSAPKFQPATITCVTDSHGNAAQTVFSRTKGSSEESTINQALAMAKSSLNAANNVSKKTPTGSHIPSSKQTEKQETRRRASDAPASSGRSNIDEQMRAAAAEEKQLQAEATLWKTALDPKSGRAYWYHVKTRETQWRKPMCCATRQERQDAQLQEQQTRDFFAAMEANVLRSMATLANATTTSLPETVKISSAPVNQVLRESVAPSDECDLGVSSVKTQVHRPRIMRTISSMEDSVLADLIQRVPSYRQATSDEPFQPLTVKEISLRPIPEAASAASLDNHLNWNSSSSSTLFNESVAEQKLGVNRENSLNFAALVASQQEQQQSSQWTSDGSSFNLSTLMNDRMNFGAMNLVPESEYEDASSSSHNEFMRENFVRQTGSMNLTPKVENKDVRSANSQTEFSKEILARQKGSSKLTQSDFYQSDIIFQPDTDSNDIIVDLLPVNGSGSLDLSKLGSPKHVSRENSMNFAALVSGAARGSGSRESSVSSKLNAGFRCESWESILLDTAVMGLSSEEGEAMKELVAITHEMATIAPSSSSASSSNSLEGLDVLSEDDDDNNHSHPTSSRRALAESSSMDLSDDEGSAAKSPTKRPPIARPSSLRTGPSPAVTAVFKSLEKPGMLRRNTCGTLYVGSTMSAPDKDATIKCVCAVFRAHILQSEMDTDVLLDEYNLFEDLESQRKLKSCATGKAATIACNLAPPTLEEVTVFYRDVFGRAQMESDCIIITLIYVERLIKATDGALRPRSANWRSILFSCMVLSSKVWDDLSMWNADFSHTCPAGVELSLQRVNELEIAVLSALQYKVKVQASEYAKYYFLLRSMLIKSGLGSEDLSTMNPLDVEGAKQLQHVSSQYQSSVASMSAMQKADMARSKSTGTKFISANNVRGNKYASPISPMVESRGKVGLEHVVQM